MNDLLINYLLFSFIFLFISNWSQIISFSSLFVGKLSLKGDVRRVPGVISIALLAKSKKINKMFVSRGNISEVVLVDGIRCEP